MSRMGWVALAAVCAVALGLLGWRMRDALPPLQHAMPVGASSGPATAATTTVPPLLAFEPFTQVEVDQFLAKARKVEAIDDPLQRCLAYPDPPGSHWNADAVRAYCRYRNLSVITFDEARRLIEAGHAAELDRRLADALHRQYTDPAAQGLLDRIYQDAFANGSFDIRPTLDAWKRQSPGSAFAYAASGLAYAEMAATARGDQFIRNTPADALLAMNRLSGLADADLRQAIALDPRVTPAYAAMMDIGRMALGHRYALIAREAGLKVAPADFYLYATANLLAEPKWGGADDELAALQQRELAHAPQNPLLYLSATDVSLRAFDLYSCNCDTPPELARVMHALQDVASFDALRSAGDSADLAKQAGLAAVYYAEAVRFGRRPRDRLSRAFELVQLGYPSWAHDDLSAVAPQLPRSGAVYRGLGYADIALEESARATGELEQAVRLDNTDTWSWESLGGLYADARQWDKAWDVADQLIRLEPQAPDGWRLRAEVQVEQPRDGLADTVQSFQQRFGDRPDQQAVLARMRDVLARRRH